MRDPLYDLGWFKKFKFTQDPTGSYGPAGLLASTDEEEVEPVSSEGGDEQVRQMLVDHPQISGPTLYNLIKSQGMKVVREADGGSAHPQVLRSFSERMRKVLEGLPIKEAVTAQESAACMVEGNIKFRSRFLESSASDNGIGHTRFRVVLIQEGLGNMKDAFYYSRKALESAVPVFEGKKIYADHPAADEEQTRPERSVKDVLGHFESVELVETDGRAELHADVVILPDEPYRWARALMRHSVEYAKKYPDKDFVGLSINATGDAEPMRLDSLLESQISESVKVKLNQAKAEGIEQIRFVSTINEAVSCDLVTEAGAGGKVLDMIEKEKATMSKKSKVKEGAVKETATEEAEKKETIEADAHPAGAADKDTVKQEAAGHDDEAQDVALIKKMIAEYLGEDMMDQEEVLKMCKEAYEAYMEMGYEADKAMEAAGHSMKLAKHMAAKEKKESEEKPEEKPEEKVEESKDEEKVEESDEEKVEESKTEETKESSQVLKLTAENAALKESLKKIEVEKHLERVLKESGLPRSVTQVFRSNLGAPKSTGEIDDKFKLFVETYRATRGSETDGLPFVVTAEKREDGSKGDMSFADCLN